MPEATIQLMFHFSYIPQVIPHPSDFDVMSEEFPRSPPWTPKRPESRRRSEPPTRSEPQKRPEPSKRDSKDVKTEHDDLPKRDNDLPKREPSSLDNDSRGVPLTPESLQSPEKQNTNNRPRGRSVLLKKMRFAAHPAKDTTSEARGQNPLPNKNDRRTQDGGMGDSSDTAFTFSDVSFDRIFGFGAYAPQCQSPPPRGWYRAVMAERYGNTPPNLT